MSNGLENQGLGYRNQHYILANAGNGNNQYLESNFASVSSNNCFWGGFWVRSSSQLNNSLPTIVATFSQTSAVNAPTLGIRFFGMTSTTANILIGYGTHASNGSMTATYQITTTTPVTLTANKWHKVQFFFNSGATDVNDNLILFNNVNQPLNVQTGTPVTTAGNMTICRLLQFSIPTGFRMANVWLSCGTNTKAEVAGYKMGEKSPLWLGDRGGLLTNKPVVMYMHGTKMVLQNSVNKAAITSIGTSFTTLTKATPSTDHVIL